MGSSSVVRRVERRKGCGEEEEGARRGISKERTPGKEVALRNAMMLVRLSPNPPAQKTKTIPRKKTTNSALPDWPNGGKSSLSRTMDSPTSLLITECLTGLRITDSPTSPLITADRPTGLPFMDMCQLVQHIRIHPVQQVLARQNLSISFLGADQAGQS